MTSDSHPDINGDGKLDKAETVSFLVTTLFPPSLVLIGITIACIGAVVSIERMIQIGQNVVNFGIGGTSVSWVAKKQH